ncbi:phosphohistidine phosphatase SixA [Glaesserella parasuis]|uniref:phosphohistidine phosphatase SixA n=1 Tax=Glaesserella parasuis TaxID=738 RepID=UPI001366129C|nr:phosphohistidine phosphatase SixA [Glaesserella parasuis]MCT8831195.1 phosphohistidine phosphatase SixA [Glaesserella parasuis]MCT8834260.1 phosphohistidine phosphatase SixA [Glaesserella parasuis]MDG6354565.1 phosphohistidine phosphatase SixA [Glaesserella parasuis]MDO9673008.1 phosphohistidine phosphatase SixA [Glaesserella parasuis]MDO9936440.1 phosphohistidine phosphatase SixA [Glaesserella parasuis]
MNIWIMRHGEAGFNAPTDAQRNLTEQGKLMAYQQGQWLAKRLENQQIKLDKVIISPYLCTQQTAQAVEQGMQAVNTMQSFANLAETWEEITPDGNPDTVIDYLAFLREEGAKHVLIISHLPLVFDLVYQLTQQRVHFSPAVIAEISKVERKNHLSVIVPRNSQ